MVKLKLWSRTDGRREVGPAIHGYVELVDGEFVFSGDNPEYIERLMAGEFDMAAKNGITDKAEILRRMHERPKSYGGWSLVEE
jgi:hypothetical protein